jgi:serine carboxypeptidase-like clade 2
LVIVIVSSTPGYGGETEAFFSGDVQVGGWTQVFGDALSFATIRGASHEAPFSQPARSLVLFRAFLASRPLPEAFE